MAQPHIQTSFHAGEWAPALNARVDLAKYKSAAALLRNFYVDYRGGVSSRPGTKYILHAWNHADPVRLIAFQASFSVSYVLEFGDHYIRFFNNGAPVLEGVKNLANVTQANPAVFTVTSHGYAIGDVLYISGAAGMTQINNRYIRVLSTPTGNTFTAGDLVGAPINSTSFPAYVPASAEISRVYKITSPYAAADLATLKFSQDVARMILCHPNYVPYVLTLVSATSWILLPAVFGSTIGPPAGVPRVTSTLSSGPVYYSYLVTSIDKVGQESTPSKVAPLQARADLRTTPGSIKITIAPVSGAVSYNIYKAEVSFVGNVPAGAAYGYIGNFTGTVFVDSNIAPDFSFSPPVANNPFVGTGVVSVTITNPSGPFSIVPDVVFGASPTGDTATGNVALGIRSPVPITVGGTGYVVGDLVYFTLGIVLRVATIGGGGAITSWAAFSPADAETDRGRLLDGDVPDNPLPQLATTSAAGTGVTISPLWEVRGIEMVSYGSGYVTPPSVTFIPASATGTAVLSTASSADPSVPAFFQQRLVLAAQQGAPQAFHMSQPGLPFNFNISNPIQPDDGISAAIVSGQLNTIKSMIPMPSGLIMLSDKAAWLINSGEANTPVTPINIVANPHSYNGASDVPPIVANFDILYVQSKGSIIRDLTYNFYANIFTGTDISVLSAHLFYGFQVTEWAWAEEPFKVVWCVRNDGLALSLTFLKEQELIGWAHSDTDGAFRSVATVTEQTDFGPVDAVYFVVDRMVGGVNLKYIERMAERIFPFSAASAWCVDSALQYVGSPATTFSGMDHLAGKTVTGLADGTIITPFVMPGDGRFTLPSPASIVTVGLPFTPQLQTLAIELGDPTQQGKRKKITGVTLRVQDTLGLHIGKTFDTLVPMKDLALGNVGSASNEVVTNLVTGDARTNIDPSWTVDGQYCISQPNPWPATILGVIPEIAPGDTPR